jgi:hypothetical protein
MRWIANEVGRIVELTGTLQTGLIINFRGGAGALAHRKRERGVSHPQFRGSLP